MCTQEDYFYKKKLIITDRAKFFRQGIFNKTNEYSRNENNQYVFIEGR